MSLMMIYAAALALVLMLALASAVSRPAIQLARCAAALGANWIVTGSFTFLVQTDGWWFNLIIDTITAAVMLYRPAGKWQAILGISYVAQLACHVGYGVRITFLGGADATLYYDWLAAIAFVQLFIVGAWGVGGLWNSLGRWHRRHSGAAKARHRDLA